MLLYNDSALPGCVSCRTKSHNKIKKPPIEGGLSNSLQERLNVTLPAEKTFQFPCRVIQDEFFWHLRFFCQLQGIGNISHVSLAVAVAC